MKFSLAVVASLFMVAQAAALPAEVEAADAQNPCPRGRTSVPFFRAFNPSLTNHFYTTNQGEVRNAINTLGYQDEGQAGRVYSTPETSTTPLHRLFNPTAGNHFYTSNELEAVQALHNGYIREDIAAHIFKDQICNSVPLFRLYNNASIDHFYTINWNERNKAISTLGYTNEGVAGYILP